MAAAASCSSAAAAAAVPAGPGPGPVSAGPGSCEWLLLRDGCLRCDADGLCSLCYHPALNAILAVTARGAIKVIDGTSGATLQASALNGERGACRALGRRPGGAGGSGLCAVPPPPFPSPTPRGGCGARSRRCGAAGQAGRRLAWKQVSWRARGFGVGRPGRAEARLGSGPGCPLALVVRA